MSDLISRDELMRYVNDRISKIKEFRDSVKAHGEEDLFAHCNGEITEARRTKRYLNMFAPSVDAVPVVHARWACDEDFNTVCTGCGRSIPTFHCYNEETEEEWDEPIDKTQFCPNCGAKMDAKEE